jgi:hypothetical protein
MITIVERSTQPLLDAARRLLAEVTEAEHPGMPQGTLKSALEAPPP